MSKKPNAQTLAAIEEIESMITGTVAPSPSYILDTAIRLTTNGCWCDECEEIEDRINRIANEEGHDIALVQALDMAEQGRRGHIARLRHRVRDVGLRNAWVSWWRMRCVIRKLRRMERDGGHPSDYFVPIILDGEAQK